MRDDGGTLDRERLAELFEQALILPPAGRRAFVDTACGGEPALRTELMSLLDAHERAPARLERMTQEIVPAVLHALSKLASPVGRVISHYDVEDVIGGGGMGVVYKAHDRTLGRRVALKFLHPHLTADPGARARLEAEARAASALDHPNIATIFEIGSIDAPADDPEAGRLFIAMAYYCGKTLRDKIAGGPLPADEALDYARQVADGLARAHDAGIMHRDIKPANLIVTDRGEVKIVDFGLAKRAGSDLTNEAVTHGTVAYMSPEQTRGAAVDHRTDIWSLGVVLYEMLAGTRPFDGENDTLLIHAIRHDEPQPLLRLRPEIPAALAQVVETCLAKDPGERFQRVAELLVALGGIDAQRFLESREGASQGPSPAGSGASLLRLPRARVRVWAPAFAAAALLAVGVGLHIGSSSAEDAPVAVAQRLVTDFPGAHILPTFSPDGSMMAFNSDASGSWQIWVQSLAGGAPVQITHVEGNATEPSWSPLNDRIAFSRVTASGAAAGIWSIDPLGATQPRKISDAGYSPSFSWDGRSIVYSHSGAIWIANADGTNPRAVAGTDRLSMSNPVEVRPAYSPDGRHIAFRASGRDTPRGDDIWVVPTTGGDPRRLTFAQAPRGRLAWTADGRFIIYASSRGGATNLWSVPSAGGDPRPVTAGAGEHGVPVVSRDGRFLLYTSRRGQWVLMRTDRVTGAHDLLLRSRNSILLPQVSPDGASIAYFSQLATGSHLFTIRSDGTDVRQLTLGDGDYNQRPTWSGDGRSLLFYQDIPTGSLRRQPLDGGPSIEVLAGFRVMTHSAARERPQGGAIAFTRVEAPESASQTSTLVRDLATGTETELELPVAGLVWSRKGDRILGTHSDAEGPYIVICPTTGDSCEVPRDGGGPIRGAFPRWSSDGSRIYFVRSVLRTERSLEVWELERGGAHDNVRKVLELAPPDGGRALGFDVTPDDHFVWNAHDGFGDAEIWIATLSD